MASLCFCNGWRDAPTHRASGVTLVCFWERIYTPWRSQSVSTLRQICDGALHLFGAGHKFSQVPPYTTHQLQVGAFSVLRYRSLRPLLCFVQVYFAASPTLAIHFATHPPCLVGSFHRRHAVGFGCPGWGSLPASPKPTGATPRPIAQAVSRWCVFGSAYSHRGARNGKHLATNLWAMKSEILVNKKPRFPKCRAPHPATLINIWHI